MNPSPENPQNLVDDIPPINDCRVLIIDDSHLTCKLIRTRLEVEGINHIEVAYDGREGLTKLKTFEPDLLILDIQMPELDGREVLRLIRSKPKYDDLPVIIESALDGVADREELVEMGATNIITKPINHNLLAMRVRIHLEHKLLIKNLRGFRKRLSKELDMARRMQADLLPSQLHLDQLAKKHGLLIESYYRPSSELGGDFWTIHSLDDDQIALLMIDFAGHGISASINTFRLSMILNDISPLGKTPAQFMERLNIELCRVLGPSEFATAFFGILNTAEQSLDYAAAGSPPLIVTHPKTQSISIADSRGVPLGINPAADYELRHIDLSEGSNLVFYSDAFPEASCTDGENLGTEGVTDLIRSGFTDPASTNKISSFLERFTDQIADQPDDDMTLIWLQRQL